MARLPSLRFQALLYANERCFWLLGLWRGGFDRAQMLVYHSEMVKVCRPAIPQPCHIIWRGLFAS